MLKVGANRRHSDETSVNTVELSARVKIAGKGCVVS